MGYRIRLNDRARVSLAQLLESGKQHCVIGTLEERVERNKLADGVIKALKDTGEYIIIIDE